METQKKSSWLERVEEIVTVLDGSTVGEFELTEGETQITIRRHPGIVTSAATVDAATPGLAIPPHGGTRAPKADKSVSIVAPLTGVYYSAASPTTPAFVNVGDVIQAGHVVALIEAMKVFNEITAETSGRVTALVATNGAVVQKGDTLIRIEPV
jgi:acetyl-CoA carboxylase biotin carboxyl carrier protein